jgi:hypothetical protein
MKKTLRRLTLSRETLRSLEDSTLNQVGGGASAPRDTCPDLCDPVVSAGPTCLC